MTDVSEETDPGLVRLVEAILFQSPGPVSLEDLVRATAPATPQSVRRSILELQQQFEGRGIVLVEEAGGWAFRTAPDLAASLRARAERPRRLSRAAVETLAVIAYQQPVTRGEIEDVRGVQTARGTLDQLIEAGLIRPGRRRDVPGRPLTWVTTPGFLSHFGLGSLAELPSREELEAAGFLERRGDTAIIRLQHGSGEEAGGDDDQPRLMGLDEERGREGG